MWDITLKMEHNAILSVILENQIEELNKNLKKRIGSNLPVEGIASHIWQNYYVGYFGSRIDLVTQTNH